MANRSELLTEYISNFSKRFDELLSLGYSATEIKETYQSFIAKKTNIKTFSSLTVEDYHLLFQQNLQNIQHCLLSNQYCNIDRYRGKYKDKEHYTPLMKASIEGNVDIVSMFLIAGSDMELTDGGVCTGYVDDSNTKDGMTPLLYATFHGKYEVLQLLLAAGANIEAKDAFGRTALIIATIQNRKDIVTLLLSYHANIESIDINGKTSLIHAIRCDLLETATILIHAGANLNSKDSTGCTALFYASCHGHIQEVILLLQFGANIEIENKYGSTALSYAARFGRSEVVAYLLAKDANIHAEDKNGRTALSWAACSSKPSTMRLLLAYGMNPNHLHVTEDELREYLANGPLYFSKGCVRRMLDERVSHQIVLKELYRIFGKNISLIVYLYPLEMISINPVPAVLSPDCENPCCSACNVQSKDLLNRCCDSCTAVPNTVKTRTKRCTSSSMVFISKQSVKYLLSCMKNLYHAYNVGSYRPVGKEIPTLMQLLMQQITAAM